MHLRMPTHHPRTLLQECHAVLLRMTTSEPWYVRLHNLHDGLSQGTSAHAIAFSTVKLMVRGQFTIRTFNPPHHIDFDFAHAMAIPRLHRLPTAPLLSYHLDAVRSAYLPTRHSRIV
ncbi:hypothetical protein Hypma_013595 [Hypsizygus marmoreus]|uniref:Uncharacterized protein n=1 Tax=Hypsizygus marmoreus TaxID=39966 RepID=A0A369JFW1_HYPMA|nr:hypothetical protein Hypma_013595 [Hypsizygus marmoreus]